jgi:maltoporin
MIEVWAGSRMYRGDDIYLLDYWPLDNLNTVGGGVGIRWDRLEARLHAGVNRLSDDYQYQETLVPGRLFGAERIVFMDRQRMVTSLGGSYRLLGGEEGPALKLKAYFEVHFLSAGSFEREDGTIEDLPRDWGWVGGVQLGGWGFAERLSHVNLFLRFGQGLGAFNEMAIPFGLDSEKQAFPRATELVIGVSANYERGIFSMLGGGYVRRFVDADPQRYDTDDGWQLVLDVRPTLVIWGPFQAAVDLSYQQSFPTGLSPTALELLDPAVFQVAPMIVFAPLGAGSYARPHIRLVYRLAYLNEGARDLYAAEDPRHDQSVVHYIGAQVEWWFNSSYR